MKITKQMTARIFKAFCDENRLEILQILAKGERCACSLLEMLSISQPTLSHHMRILQDAGVVSARREGKWTYYTINESGAQLVRELLDEILCVQ